MILSDHVKKGKKLLPPLLAGGYPMELGNWPLDRVPEFFWLAVLVERIGRRQALDLITRMSKAIHLKVNKHRAEFKVIRPYVMSTHLSFSEQERQTIVRESRSSKWFEVMSPFVAELKTIWPDIPVGYLATRKVRTSRLRLTREIRDVLSRFSYRHDELADVVQAIIAITEIRSGHVSNASHLDWPDFDAIIENPKSEVAKHAAGFAVTMCGQLNRFGREQDDLKWNRHFWNCCYRLEPCEYDYG